MNETWQIILSAIGGAAGVGVLVTAIFTGLTKMLKQGIDSLSEIQLKNHALKQVDTLSMISDKVVKALDQSPAFKDLAKEDKARLAMSMTKQLAEKAGIPSIPDVWVQTPTGAQAVPVHAILNEAAVKDAHSPIKPATNNTEEGAG
jgi:hypothetical protein